jgi:hypothetical protein
MAGLLFSTIGLWLIKQAKQKGNIKLLPIAIGLIAYSYFTTQPIFDWGIGIALCAAAYHFWD